MKAGESAVRVRLQDSERGSVLSWGVAKVCDLDAQTQWTGLACGKDTHFTNKLYAWDRTAHHYLPS